MLGAVFKSIADWRVHTAVDLSRILTHCFSQLPFAVLHGLKALIMRTPDMPKRYVFLLLDGFSPMGFNCALETLAHVNRHKTNRTYYSWRILSERSTHAIGWNGIHIACDDGLVSLYPDETLVVVGGENILDATTKPLLNWLRREARKGIDIGAISSAVYPLAKAGLLHKRHATTHWEYHATMTETLLDVQILDNIFDDDGKIFTCAGGASCMDLMLHRITKDYGEELAFWVADQMIYYAPRTSTNAQRMSVLNKTGVRHVKLAQTVDLMWANLEDPIPPSELADVIGLSTRQLERLFQRYLETSPKKYYLSLRLEKARNLLRQTPMPIIDIAVACGFESPSHFSKCYKKHYGTLPSRERAFETQ